MEREARRGARPSIRVADDGPTRRAGSGASTESAQTTRPVQMVLGAATPVWVLRYRCARRRLLRPLHAVLRPRTHGVPSPPWSRRTSATPISRCARRPSNITPRRAVRRPARGLRARRAHRHARASPTTTPPTGIPDDPRRRRPDGDGEGRPSSASPSLSAARCRYPHAFRERVAAFQSGLTSRLRVALRPPEPSPRSERTSQPRSSPPVLVVGEPTRAAIPLTEVPRSFPPRSLDRGITCTSVWYGNGNGSATAVAATPRPGPSSSARSGTGIRRHERRRRRLGRRDRRL